MSSCFPCAIMTTADPSEIYATGFHEEAVLVAEDVRLDAVVLVFCTVA